MKKKILLGIIAIMLFSLCGCRETNTTENKENTIINSQEINEKEDSGSDERTTESSSHEEYYSSSHDENHSNHHEDEHH